MPTLAIASLASVVAAVVVSHFWGPGTIAATAATPVIVALVRETLARPAQRITEVSARAPRAAARVMGAQRDAEGPTVVAEEVQPGGETEAYRVYGRPSGRRPWRVAVITGLAAFAIAAAAITVPEIVAGHSIVSRHKATTLFRGSSGHHKSQTTTPTTATTVTTVTQTTTAPTQTTPTVTQTTPTVTQTTPPPTQTTPPTSGGTTVPTTP